MSHQDCWNTIGVWGDVYPRCERLATAVHCRNCEVYAQAGRNVFERRPPKGYVTQWRNSLADAQQARDKAETGIMVFRLGQEWYAVPAALLQEVAERRPIHRVPHNDNPYIAGVVNIGGEVRICYSLTALLGAGEFDIAEIHRLLVVEVDSQRYVFPVNEVSGLIRCNMDELSAPPATLAERQASLVVGICDTETNKIGVLDMHNIDQQLQGLKLQGEAR